jgi:hypothetical protein
LAGKRLFGFAHHYKPEPRTVGNKTYQPSEADHLFREALTAFLEWDAANGPEPEPFPKNADVEEAEPF